MIQLVKWVALMSKFKTELVNVGPFYRDMNSQSIGYWQYGESDKLLLLRNGCIRNKGTSKDRKNVREPIPILPHLLRLATNTDETTGGKWIFEVLAESFCVSWFSVNAQAKFRISIFLLNPNPRSQKVVTSLKKFDSIFEKMYDLLMW